MTHHQIGRTREDLSFFREQNYHALSRQDAARWADLGAYRAPSTQNQYGRPVTRPVIIYSADARTRRYDRLRRHGTADRELYSPLARTRIID
jgi:hypothetical protein